MIFVTVGSQMPFDRLVRAVDQWAGQENRSDVFAQIGPGGRRPQNIQWAELVGAAAFRQRIEMSRLVLGHAGIGTILSCLELGRPLIVMARRQALRETRNDHQVATARRFSDIPGVCVIDDESQLKSRIEEWDLMSGLTSICDAASPELLGTVRRFIAKGGPARS